MGLLCAVSLITITAAGAPLNFSIRPGSEAGGLNVRSPHCPGDVFDFRTCEGVVVALDETPVGTFVELEGNESGIAAVAERLGRTPADYVIDSYRTLFVAWQQAHGASREHMVFEPA